MHKRGAFVALVGGVQQLLSHGHTEKCLQNCTAACHDEYPLGIMGTAQFGQGSWDSPGCSSPSVARIRSGWDGVERASCDMFS